MKLLAVAAPADTYTCPMHPEIVSETPVWGASACKSACCEWRPEFLHPTPFGYGRRWSRDALDRLRGEIGPMLADEAE
jgi:hypothetical protein